MLVTFRQGIVRRQTSPFFLSFSGGVVNLNASTDPTIIAFADGTADYLYTESESISGAWSGPFTGGTDYWLYWDIDKNTGIRTFGATTIEPTFGSTRPSSPSNDQHFFDTSVNKMVVWNGNRWVERIRVFAAELQSGVTIVAEGEGSQVNINQNRNIGHILFDSNGEVVKRTNSQFLTTETPVNASDNPLNSYKLEARQVRARAVEAIPKFHAVTWKGPNRIGLASNRSPDEGECVGIAVEDINKDEIRKFATDGFVINEEWNFTEVPGTLLFVGPSGEITTTVPQRISMQRVGQVVDANTAFIDIRELFRIDTPPASPTPTPSVTPTSSVAVTATPTPTATVTPTITGTPGASPTATPTPTATVTPTSTSAVTSTPAVTPTVTPTESVPAVSPTPTPTEAGV